MVAKHGQHRDIEDNNITPVATVAEIGIRSDQIHEARQFRDAEKAEPGATEARNFESECKVSNVRLQAEYKAGKLLKELARAETAKGGKTGANQHVAAPVRWEPPPSPYAAALAETGISTQTASRFVEGSGEKLPHASRRFGR